MLLWARSEGGGRTHVSRALKREGGGGDQPCSCSVALEDTHSQPRFVVRLQCETFDLLQGGQFCYGAKPLSMVDINPRFAVDVASILQDTQCVVVCAAGSATEADTKNFEMRLKLAADVSVLSNQEQGQVRTTHSSTDVGSRNTRTAKRPTTGKTARPKHAACRFHELALREHTLAPARTQPNYCRW